MTSYGPNRVLVAKGIDPHDTSRPLNAARSIQTDPPWFMEPLALPSHQTNVTIVSIFNRTEILMSTTPEQFDAIVIGSGEAGKYMSWTLGAQGQRVIAIEDKRICGACPNVACLPSKNVVHSAKVAQYFQRGAEFGMICADWQVDMAGVNARRQKLVDHNLQVHLANFAKSHAEIVMGFGRFIADKTVEVTLNTGGTRTLRSDRIFLDTGSRATIDPIPGLAE